MKELFIKHFKEYLNGNEVETSVKLAEDIRPGDRVLAFRNSISATSSISVPKSKQDDAIGIEGVVVDIQPMDNNRGLKVIVRKI